MSEVMRGRNVGATPREVRIWLGAFLIATALTIWLGPFGTIGFPTWERVIYWLASNSVSLGLMFAIVTLCQKLKVRNFALLAILCSCLFAFLFTPFSLWLSQEFSGEAPPMMGVWLNVVFIALAIFAMVYLGLRCVGGVSQMNVNTPTLPAKPALATRLRQYPNGTILALEAQDHYVKIITDHGNELVRMRMQDAVREMNGVAGLQTHRSYWVARAGIRKIERHNGKSVLRLQNGATVPISQRRLAELNKTR